MIRLTDKNCSYNEYVLSKNKTIQHAINDSIYDKLSKLEDIEDEPGVDLITLFKIIKQKYVYTNSFNRRVEEFVFTKIEGIEKDYLGRTYLRIAFQEVEYDENGNEKYGIQWVPNLKDYGKTWSLDKSDLVGDILETQENDKRRI